MARTFTRGKGGYQGAEWSNLPAGRRPKRSCPKHGPELVGTPPGPCYGCHVDQLVASGFYTAEIGEAKKAAARDMLAVQGPG